MRAPKTAQEVITPYMPLILDPAINREEKQRLICIAMREYAVDQIQVLNEEIRAVLNTETLPLGDKNKPNE